MTDTIFTPSRQSVEYYVRYMERLFHVLLKEKREDKDPGRT